MIINKNDFVELKYTGYAQGEVFDSNIVEDMKNLSNKNKPREAIVVIGQGMVVSGLDKALEGKEIGKEFKINLKFNEAFGERKKNLVRLIPLNAFHEKKVDPKPGMVLALDDVVVKILTVSGARVIADFNNPLAGKDVEYKFIIVRKIEDEQERIKVLFMNMFKFVPKYEVGNEVIVIGPKFMESFTKAYNSKFKELIGKGLGFRLEEKQKNTDDKSKKS